MCYLAVYEQLYVARVREREQTLVDYNAVLLQAFLFALIFWQFLKAEEKNMHTGSNFKILQNTEVKGRQIVKKSELLPSIT